MIINEYYTIEDEGETNEIIEKSKFISYAFPVKSEEKAVEIINSIKKMHYKATHNVYAYVIGENKETQKASDDGEPSGTAGVPILEMIKKENLTDVLIVVTRYFGGIKLGAGGLIRAYAHMAKIVIEASQIVKKALCEKTEVIIDYTYLGRIQNELGSKNMAIEHIEYTDKVYIYIYLQEHQKEFFYSMIQETTNGEMVINNLGKEYISLVI